MKKIALILLTILFITGCSTAMETTGDRTGETLTSKEAHKESVENVEVLIVDVRTPEEYAEGHIAGSVNIPLDQIEDVAAIELPNKDQEIFVVCRSGNRSGQAQVILESNGYTNITNIGSVFDWPEGLVTNP